LERLKPIQRNAASAAAEQEGYRPELIADEEPKFLRRQKPVEIRRKKIGGKSWSFYRQLFFWSLVVGAALTAAIVGTRFALHSPQMLLVKPDQIDVSGNHIVPKEEIQKLFIHDRNKSVLQIPLDARRSQVQEVSWVEEASVQRILPNRLRVEITERTPIAFFRNGAELTLIDAHGVLLDRPEGEDFHFPIVTGLSENIPRDERETRMKIYQDFMKSIELVGSAAADRGKGPVGASEAERVSEVDLSNPRDLRVVLTGLAGRNDPQAVTVHFGQNDFIKKYGMLVENFAQWQANAGRVQSIDLQYARQVVVNPDTSAPAAKHK
jgi:cell division protein FtsQ